MQSLIMTSLQGNKSQHELELIQFIHQRCVGRAWEMDKLSVNEVLLNKQSTHKNDYL